MKVENSVQGLAVAWIFSEGCRVEASGENLLELLRSSARAALEGSELPDAQSRRAAVRDMLRFGSYKPTGRGKPASEYLLRAASEGTFPEINSLVDINNLVSVKSQFPISMVDTDKAGSAHFLVRRGREGEEYVFNPSGQVLSLRDLLLAARMPEDAPCATPIKDCQATKTDMGTRNALALIYAPGSLRGELESAAAWMAGLVSEHCGGEVASGLV